MRLLENYLVPGQTFQNYLVPGQTYDFKSHNQGTEQRSFRHQWLTEYEWMAFSSYLKGALCRYCVLFPPKNVQGMLGAFIVKSFTKYRELHNHARDHASMIMSVV